jgi:hypothetical protein
MDQLRWQTPQTEKTAEWRPSVRFWFQEKRTKPDVITLEEYVPLSSFFRHLRLLSFALFSFETTISSASISNGQIHPLYNKSYRMYNKLWTFLLYICHATILWYIHRESKQSICTILFLFIFSSPTRFLQIYGTS